VSGSTACGWLSVHLSERRAAFLPRLKARVSCRKYHEHESVFTSYEKIAESPDQWQLDEAEFAEDKRFDQAQKWPLERSDHTTNALDLLKWEAFNQITENRLQSAISKVGLPVRGQQKRAQQIFQLVVQDVLEEIKQHQSELQ
jgi:hypothetical protein